MITATAWQIHTSSAAEWLRGLSDRGLIDKNDTVWSGPDGSYGVGEPTLDQMDDEALMEMSDVGQVGEWLEVAEAE